MGGHGGKGRRRTVVIVDDEPTIRMVVRTLAEAATDLEVVGEAADGLSGIALVRREQPDAVIVDGQMPHLDGWDTARLLRQEAPDLVIVMFSGDPPSGSRRAPFDAIHHKSEGADVMLRDVVALLAARR